MLIRVKSSSTISENEVTPEKVFLHRRKFIKDLALISPTLLGLHSAFAETTKNPKYKVEDKDHSLTREDLITGYNNYYEFSFEKTGVKAKAEKWKRPTPWTIEFSGLIEKPITLNLEDILKIAGSIEERIYRFRCVEAWSMVVPWGGFPLKKLIDELKIKKTAKYIKFTSYADDKQMPEIKNSPQYPWPYTEGLRLDEAMHPLAFLATQIYGKDIPNQNGAPVRLVVPWKYGFKSIKSIQKIEFTDKEPKTLWNQLAPNEYGFLANVNPEVDHPRWSQGSERVLDGSFLPKKIKTLKFNGYGNEVADLYKGIDLKKNY